MIRELQASGLMTFFIGICVLFTLIVILLVVQKLKYDKLNKELSKIHKEQAEHTKAMTRYPVTFDKDFMSYEHYSKLPYPGKDNTLYFIRQTKQHYFWNQNSYRGIRFESFEDSLPKRELTIHYIDGTATTYTVVAYVEGEFCFAKFMKWYMTGKTELFQYELTEGFDVIARSRIKQVSYRSD